MHTRHSDVLIIGTGLAGLSVALSLPPHVQIDLLSKGPAEECASAWAQGGIAAVLDAQDSFDAHVQDTLIAGAGMCDEAVVRSIVSQAPAAIAWLRGHGVPFDVLDDGTTLHLTREGGHSHRRIAHVADRTGQALHATLLRVCRERSNIRLHPSHTALDLLKAGERCTGAQVMAPDGSVITWLAGHTVLATGGLGQLFSRTTNPPSATGDGVAMAWRAGCDVRDLEFIQFHPTALQIDGRSVGLVTEALRGEGALLRLPNGERFMPAHDHRAELAPRDIVARAIWHEMNTRGLAHVDLDISHRPREWLAQHFPGVMQLCASHGIDIASEPIPVAPCAHYSCGGVVADVSGRTDLPGLHVIGETARTGLHGANRLASNSLLECVVMGRAAARCIENSEPVSLGSIAVHAAKQSGIGDDNDTIHQALEQLMDECAGIRRSQSELMRAATQMTHWRLVYGAADHALNNKIDVSLLIVNAAIERRESCGAHSRIDEPIHASLSPQTRRNCESVATSAGLCSVERE